MANIKEYLEENDSSSNSLEKVQHVLNVLKKENIVEKQKREFNIDSIRLMLGFITVIVSLITVSYYLYTNEKIVETQFANSFLIEFAAVILVILFIGFLILTASIYFKLELKRQRIDRLEKLIIKGKMIINLNDKYYGN